MCQETPSSPVVESTTTSNAEALQEPLLSRGDDDTVLVDQPKNRNINLTLLYTFLAFAGRSLWSQSVLSTLVFLLRNNDPKAVGFITASMGLAQLVASAPAGILADKFRRDWMLKVASTFGIIATGLAFIAVQKESYIWLTIALSVWGLFWGTANTSLGALFADSIPDGERSHYFTQRSILIKMGNMAGPTAALILFSMLGDMWTIQDCAIVFSVGNALCVPALIVLCFMSDDFGQENGDDNVAEPLLELEEDETPVLEIEPDPSLEPLIEPTLTTPTTTCWRCIPENRVIPVLIATADILSGLGSGMSIRYFPIFFVTDLKLSPVLVQVLYIISPALQAVLMKVAQHIALHYIGRCRMTVIFKWCGIMSMVLMIVAHHYKQPLWLICTCYILRTAFMNATTALTKSVLMDAVPKHERGKWSSLESVNMFSWSGSAALGGMLVGWKGLVFNFCCTASMQFLATLPLIALFERDVVEGTMQRQSSTLSGIEEEEIDDDVTTS